VLAYSKLPWASFLGASAVLAFFFILSACNFPPLFQPLGAQFLPSGEEAVLSSVDNPLRVLFDEAPQHAEAELLLEVRSPWGLCAGDMYWEDTALCFLPPGGWLAGTRYTARMRGLLVSEQGSDLQLNIRCSFSAGNQGPLCVLETFSPSDGSVVQADAFSSIKLRFSMPMDRESVRTAFSIQSALEYDWVWSVEDTQAELVLSSPLKTGALYQWHVSETAKSREGQPLFSECAGAFISSPLAASLRIASVSRVSLLDESYLLLGELSESAHADDSFLIRFSSAVQMQSLSGAIRLEPGIALKLRPVAEDSVLCTPARPLQAQTEYALRIAPTIKDALGLALAEAGDFRFFCQSQYLRLLAIQSGMAPELVLDSAEAESETGAVDREGRLGTDSAALLPLHVQDGRGIVRLRFSHAFSPEQQRTALSYIRLSAFFPYSLKSPALRRAWWPASNCLELEWEALEFSDASSPAWYRLSLYGGERGFAAAKGLFMAEDMELYLEGWDEE
jgi:hypothetical protein